jgi:hypothetical protein
MIAPDIDSQIVLKLCLAENIHHEQEHTIE